jgi:hypothetical protein
VAPGFVINEIGLLAELLGGLRIRSSLQAKCHFDSAELLQVILKARQLNGVLKRQHSYMKRADRKI